MVGCWVAQMVDLMVAWKVEKWVEKTVAQMVDLLVYSMAEHSAEYWVE